MPAGNWPMTCGRLLTLRRLLRGSLASAGGPRVNQAGGGATGPSLLIGRWMRVAVLG
jgi:hypothetical protein